MKYTLFFILFTSTLFCGCVIPCNIFFRNFSDETVRLSGKISDRRRFDKLPNKVNFYAAAEKEKEMYGNWTSEHLINWFDSTSFYIDVPAKTVINIGDISNGLTLGTRSPDVLLIAVGNNKTDTVTTGDYPSVAAKFKATRPLFAKPDYYYDFK
ncbi:MAG: hypothetical protein QM791_14300 [Ferruginibacter sp.]